MLGVGLGFIVGGLLQLAGLAYADKKDIEIESKAWFAVVFGPTIVLLLFLLVLIILFP